MMRSHYGYQILHFVVALLLNKACCNPGYFELMRQNCPFTDFCSVKSLESYNASSTVTPCCSKCSCEADCWVFNNCCPDVNHTESADLQKANCIEMLVTKKFYPETSMMDSTYQRYLVIDFCPRYYDVIDQVILDNCEERFNGSVVSNDIVAVSDGKGRIYKNRFCALCHGVHDVVRWNLEMKRCSGNFKPSTIEATDYLRTLMDNCPLESVIPKELSHTSITMECSNNINRDCPFSSQTEIQQGCLLGPNMTFFFIPSTLRLSRYKNVFCYLCQNSVDIQQVQHVCQAEIVDSKRTLTGAFALLLDTTISERVSESKPLDMCPFMTVWDHVKSQCLKLHCPLLSVFANGECLALGYVSNAVFELQVRLEPRGQTILLDNVQPYNDGMTLLKDALKRYELSMCDAKRFYLYVYSEKNSKRMAYALASIFLVLGEKCQLEDIARAVRNRLSNYQDAPLVINSVIYQFTEKFDFYHGGLDNLDLERWTMVFYNPFSILIQLDGFFMCPHFIFSLQEYNFVITDVFGKNDKNLTEISEFTRVLNGFYTLTPNSIAVCVDTYFDLYKKNGGESNVRTPSVSFLGILLVGILYLETIDMHFF